MAREQNAKVTLTYRLPERLRARLEEAAQLTDTSLNNEITGRLQKSFEQEDQLRRAAKLNSGPVLDGQHPSR